MLDESRSLTVTGGAATGIGSVPGTDVLEWCTVLRGELPDFPHLPELPDRGPGADMIGRTLGALAAVSPDLSGETTPDGWRFAGAVTSGPPRVMRRAQSWLAEDLDAAAETWDEFGGPFKISMAGPWTLAASVEMLNGERALVDAGAVRDLVAACEAVASNLVREVTRRLPKANIWLQIDEPAIPAVRAGAIATQSGFSAYRGIDDSQLRTGLASIVRSAQSEGASVAVHCCGSHPPLGLFREAGADAISVDLLLADSDDEEFGAILESGLILMAGVVPAVTVEPDVRPVQRILELLSRLGIRQEEALPSLVVTPTCGLAGANNPRAVYNTCNRVSRALRDQSVAAGNE